MMDFLPTVSGYNLPKPLRVKMGKKLVIVVGCLGILFLSSSLWAGDNQDYDAWLASFRHRAVASGISPQVVERALGSLKYNPQVIKLDRHQPEFKLSFADYLRRTVRPGRVGKGRDILREKSALFADITKHYGVPPAILLAFWGIETDFGRITGSFDTIEALATLSYDPRRSAFFTRELLAALRLLENNYLLLEDMRGSWAGALGYMQFLPSVYLRYGVDYDSDGAVSIFQGGGDLLASAANYLASSGWRRGWRWGREVRATPGDVRLDSFLGLEHKRDLAAWSALGVRRLSGAELPKAEVMASLVHPRGTERYFLVYDNFRVIMKWNHSVYYALAVGLLADEIAGG